MPVTTPHRLAPSPGSATGRLSQPLRLLQQLAAFLEMRGCSLRRRAIAAGRQSLRLGLQPRFRTGGLQKKSPARKRG